MATPIHRKRRCLALKSRGAHDGGAVIEFLWILTFAAAAVGALLWGPTFAGADPSEILPKVPGLGVLVGLLIAQTLYLRTKLEALSKQDGLNAREQQRLGHIVEHKLTVYGRIFLFYVVLTGALIVVPMLPMSGRPGATLALACLGGATGVGLYLARVTWMEIRSAQSFIWRLDNRRIQRTERDRVLDLFKNHDHA